MEEEEEKYTRRSGGRNIERERERERETNEEKVSVFLLLLILFFFLLHILSLLKWVKVYLRF